MTILFFKLTIPNTLKILFVMTPGTSHQCSFDIIIGRSVYLWTKIMAFHSA